MDRELLLKYENEAQSALVVAGAHCEHNVLMTHTGDATKGLTAASFVADGWRVVGPSEMCLELTGHRAYRHVALLQ